MDIKILKTPDTESNRYLMIGGNGEQDRGGKVMSYSPYEKIRIREGVGEKSTINSSPKEKETFYLVFSEQEKFPKTARTPYITTLYFKKRAVPKVLLQVSPNNLLVYRHIERLQGSV